MVLGIHNPDIYQTFDSVVSEGGGGGGGVNVIFYQNMPIIDIHCLKENFYRKTWNIC